jgi:hypothetical protein
MGEVSVSIVKYDHGTKSSPPRRTVLRLGAALKLAPRPEARHKSIVVSGSAASTPIAIGYLNEPSGLPRRTISRQ